MPKKVDHQQRRQQIIEGLIRLAAREGLHAVTMRAVAKESGVSLRLVQYYFDDKAQLMLAALEALEQRSQARWATRLDTLPQPTPLRAYLEALFAEALPTDAASRTFHRVWMSYAVLAMTDPAYATQPFVEGPNRLESQLVAALGAAQKNGELAADVDTTLEARRLLALIHGLGTSVLVGQQTTASATAVMQHHLAQLLSEP